MHPNRIAHQNVLVFMVAGKAIFTVRGKENRFTYKVEQPTFRDGPSDHIRFVYVLTGPENSSDYSFFGSLFKKNTGWEFRLSPKSKVSPGALSIVAFNYIFGRVTSNLPFHRDVEVWHNGHCGRCGHLLTIPESIEIGLGPVCARM